MRSFIPALILTVCASTAFAVDSGPWRITAVEWAAPRDGEAMVAMPALSHAVQAFRGTESGRLEIRYPGGDTGALWARELRAWLVALGVASADIELVPGSADERAIELRVTDAR